MLYFWIKLIHIISSTLLFGTGLGSAFYMYRAQKTADINTMYFAARNVVIADFLFTTPSVFIQPITGFAMIYIAGFSLTNFWVWASLVLYVMVGACWLPVVYIQMKMRQLLAHAIKTKQPLTKQYYHYYRTWFCLGWPAFIGVIVIFALMVLKP